MADRVPLVEAGQAYMVGGGVWNRVATTVNRINAGGVSGGSDGRRGSSSSGWRAVYHPEEAVAAGSVWELVTAPASAPQTWRASGQVHFALSTPEAQGRAVVIVERRSLGARELGVAASSGIVLARVEVTDSTHGFAKVVAGKTVLESTATPDRFALIGTPEQIGEQDFFVEFLGGASPVPAVLAYNLSSPVDGVVRERDIRLLPDHGAFPNHEVYGLPYDAVALLGDQPGGLD